MKNKKITELPGVPVLEKELRRIKYKRKFAAILKNTVFTLITVAAVSVLVATLWLPVLQIFGNSMTPTLNDGEIVVSVKSKNYETGDMIAFYYNNKILIKRVIAQPGEWVDIDRDGVVSVNGVPIDEPYLTEKAKGECDIEMPYQVPEQRVFVMGDHRSVSLDSRSSSIGCVAQEQVVGIIKFKVWPLKKLGKID